MSHRNDCNGFLLCYDSAPYTTFFTWQAKQYLRKVKSDYAIFSLKLSNSFPSEDKIQSPDHHLQDLKNTVPSISLTLSLTRSLPCSLVFSYSGFEVFVLTFFFAWNAFLPDISWFAPELHCSLGLNMLSEHPALFSFTIHTIPDVLYTGLLSDSSHWNINSMRAETLFFPLLVT